MSSELKKTGIAGAGTMGIQLTALLLSQGFEVVLLSRNPLFATETLNKFLFKRYGKTDPEFDLSRLTITSDIKLLSETQIIIECIKEDLNLKRSLIRDLLEINQTVIVGSCTSSLTLKELTNDIPDHGRVQIIHFSNPVAKMKAIELVISDNASVRVKKDIKIFFSRLQHKVIEVPDVPGFVINTIIFAMLDKANLLVREHGISRENVDELIKTGCGLPMGPFEIEKLIGIETVELIQSNLNAAKIRNLTQ
jgi:3-hydroxybutyryl-CoA dehydrogenase